MLLALVSLTLICSFLPQSGLSQVPEDSLEPPSHIYDYDDDYSDYDGGVWEIDSCQSPVIESIATVILENGQVAIEVIFASEYPQPSNIPFFPAGKFSDEFFQVGEVTYYWEGSPSDESGLMTMIYLDPCSESFVEVPILVECNPSVGSRFPNLEFYEEYEAWRANPNGVTLMEFLNESSSLTTMQRWAFYQSTVLDCTPIEEITPTIPDGLTPVGLCNCDVISLDWTLSQGDAPFIGGGPGDGEIEYFPDGWRENPPGANSRVLYHTIEGGATKHLAVRYIDLYGNGEMNSKTLGIAADSGNPRTTSAIITLQCMNGEGLPDECGCSKPIEINYEYGATLYTRAELRGSFAGRKKASAATAVDVASFSYEFEGENEVPVAASAHGIARSCEKEINDDFVDNFFSAVQSLLTLGLVASDSTQTVLQNGDTLLVEAGTALAELFNTDFNVSDTCNTDSQTHGFEGSIYDLTLEPNKTLTLKMSSSEHLEVWGRRSHDSKSMVTSATKIAYYITSQEGNTPDWCCSDHIGGYIASSLSGDFPQESLHDGVASLFFNNGGGLPDLDEFSDYGARVNPNSSNDDCADITIQTLVFSNGPVARKKVVDLLGRTIAVISPRESVESSQINDGIYYLIFEDKEGRLVESRSLHISNNQIQTNEWFD